MAPDVIRIEQVGNKLNAIKLDGPSMKPTALEFFKATLGDQRQDAKIEVQMANYTPVALLFGGKDLEGHGVGPENYSTATLWMADSDRFSINGSSYYFERVGYPEPDDVSCMPSNYLATMGPYAYVRGQNSAKEKNYEQAACWYKIAASETDPRGATSLGMLEMQGLVGAETGKTSVEWLEKGATDGDYFAALLLAEIYAKGNKEVAQDKAQALHWKEEANRMRDAQLQKEAEQRRQEARAEAALHQLEGILYVTEQVLNSEVSRSVGCDISCGPNDMLTCRSRIEARDARIAAGEINCAPKPLNLSMFEGK